MAEPRSSSGMKCRKLVGNLKGVRVFLYNEFAAMKTRGIFLLSPKYYDERGDLVFKDKVSPPAAYTFKLSALINRDFYNLAKELVTQKLTRLFGPKTIELLAQNISQCLSCFSFVGNNNNCLPIVVLVLDICILYGQRQQHDYEYGEFHFHQDVDVDVKTSYIDADLFCCPNRHSQLFGNDIVDGYVATKYEDNHRNVNDLYAILYSLRWCHDANSLKFEPDKVETSYEARLSLVAHAMDNKSLVNIKSTLQFKQTKDYVLSDDDICSICHSSMCEAVDITQLVNCIHTFHTKCLFRWFSRHPSCPLCRFVGTSLLCYFN